MRDYRDDNRHDDDRTDERRGGGQRRTDLPPPPPPPLVEKGKDELVVAEDNDDFEDDEAAQMAKLMGFSGFDTTQNKHVNDPNTNVSGVFKKTKREARQYMNRPGGFNKPLPSEKTR